MTLTGEFLEEGAVQFVRGDFFSLFMYIAGSVCPGP